MQPSMTFGFGTTVEVTDPADAEALARHLGRISRQEAIEALNYVQDDPEAFVDNLVDAYPHLFGSTYKGTPEPVEIYNLSLTQAFTAAVQIQADEVGYIEQLRQMTGARIEAYDNDVILQIAHDFSDNAEVLDLCLVLAWGRFISAQATYFASVSPLVAAGREDDYDAKFLSAPEIVAEQHITSRAWAESHALTLRSSGITAARIQVMYAAAAMAYDGEDDEDEVETTQAVPEGFANFTVSFTPNQEGTH